MKFVCPYGVRFQENGRREVFPAAEILVFGRRGKGIRALFHVDSGATASILPAGDAAVLGVVLARGKRLLVHGIGDSFLKGYQHTVRLQFGRVNIPAPVIFVEGAATPRVLGREGVFPRFGILFDEARRRLVFLDQQQERKRIDPFFLLE